MPLAAGLDTKSDPRALKPPSLAVCKNAEFDEVGGIQKRKPYSSIGVNILGGGTLSGIRHIERNGDERLAFTAEGLYSWSARDSAWVLKATYLAPKVTERSVNVDPTEQIETDRCEVGNCVLRCWVRNHATATSRKVYVAAEDKTTGATILAATQPSSGGVTGIDRPRLVALASKALLFFVDSSTNLVVLSLTPGQLATDLTTAATTVLAAASFNTYYDAVSDGTQAYFACRRQVTTSYTVGFVTSALAITSSNKAFTCDGPIAVAVSPGGANKVVVARANATAIRAEVLNATTLGNVSTDVSLGTASAATVNQITACYRSVQVAGQYSCHVFWTAGETVSGDATYQTETNTIDNAGAAGTETTLATNFSLASRPFDHNGRVFFNVVFALESSSVGASGSLSFRAQLQNTYFLWRDDGLLIAKAATHKAAGFRSVIGHLPGVQNIASNTYAWCGGERRVIEISSKHSGYSDRAPRDITVEMDSNEARRCVRLGQTLYVTGGEVRAYDGTNLVECGWHLFPWQFIYLSSAVAGNLEAGDYTWGSTYRWDNAQGERDRSTMVSTDTATIAASKQVVLVIDPAPQSTHKTNSCQEVWRTPKNPADSAPMYLVTSQDPTAVTGANAYVPNAAGATTLVDDFADATLTTKEAFPENNGVLENLAPPPASIIVASQDRLFLAGVSDNPYRVVYSKLRGEGEVAQFHEALAVDVPPIGGDITGLGFLNETLIVFCETAVFAVPGDGYDNTGQGQNYGPPRLLSADCGAVTHESIALTPQGLVFKSSKGWYLLNKGWGVDYIGRPVAAFDSDTVVAVHVMESKHQVRCLMSSARMLVLDYSVPSESSPAGQWSEWTIADGVSAAIWGGTYHYASSSAVKAEQSTYSATDYSLEVETGWIRLAGWGGFQRCREVILTGEYRSAHDVRTRIAVDGDESDASGPNWIVTDYWTATPTTVGKIETVRVGVTSSYQMCRAVKVSFKDFAVGSTTNSPAGEGLKLTDLSLVVGIMRGPARNIPPAQRS